MISSSVLRRMKPRWSAWFWMAFLLHCLGTGISAQTGTPNFQVSYSLPTNQNSVALTNGGTLQFPPTLLGSTNTATVVIANTGTAVGAVTSITGGGQAFQLVGLPVLPYNVAPNATLIFGIRYAPTQSGADTGTLALGLAGNTLTASLNGSSVASNFSYAVSTPTGEVAFTPGQTVPIPDTQVGSTTSILIQVRNTSAVTAAISNIAATPSVYTITNPPILPATVNPNGVIAFTLNFKPTVAGKTAGSLQVGSDLFVLDATGLGSEYTFSYGTGTPVSVVSGGTVIFSPVQVGQTAQIPFTVTNKGTVAGTIASIAVADTTGVYKLLDTPGLPVTLSAGGTAAFTIVFTPATTGFATTTLQIDTQTFTLSGSGTHPPPLPAFQFTGATGAVGPLQQPAIGLTLSSPYALPLNGVLTITMNSAVFAADPSVQFSTGGLTVAFTIPANTTQAIFPNGAPQILLQSGSTQGTITISPKFATQSGLDLTPASPPAVVLTVPAAAPQLLNAQVTNVTNASFALSLTGLTTTHALTTLTFQFTPTGGGKPTQYTVDVTSAAGVWFNSSASQPFGGQFAVAVPFALPSPYVTAPATSNIQSVSVTAANAQGASTAVSLLLQ